MGIPNIYVVGGIMLGHRICKANLKAKQRFKIWYPDYDRNDPAWRNCPKEFLFGSLRKTNVKCSCQMCRNPRHSTFTPKHSRPTIQERRAPTVKDFENEY